MNDNKQISLSEVGKAVELCGKYIQLAAQPQTQPPTVITDEIFESERRKRILNELSAKLLGKNLRVPLLLVSEWSKKTQLWFNTLEGKKALPLRNDEKMNRRLPDVIKFLCDLWNIPYPQELKDFCRKHVGFENLTTKT